MEFKDFVNLHAPAIGPWHVVAAAKELGCEAAALRAVLEVECRGHGFDRRGVPIMLFEPHVFYRVLSTIPTRAKRDAAVAAGLAYPKWRKGYPDDSYPRLLAAMKIDEELALRSASWGLPQILGENFEAANYSSAKAMVQAFVQSEPRQLEAMIDFLQENRLDRPLVRHDWAAFAKGYNGPGYARNQYDILLAIHYAEFAADTRYAETAEPAKAPPLSIPSMDRPVTAPKPTWWQRLTGVFEY